MSVFAKTLVHRSLSMCFLLLVIAMLAGIYPVIHAATPEEEITGATKVEGLMIQDVKVLQEGTRLYFVMPDNKSLPAAIVLPRIANVVRSIHWTSENKATMQVKSEPNEWTIELSKPPDEKTHIIVAELDAPFELFDEHLVVRADRTSGIVLFPAKFASTHGTKLRFEPQPHKNTVGYWSDLRDTAEWKFEYPDPGTYDVDILQGCGKGHGGSRVTLLVADQSLDFVVEETGHFQNFIWRTLGSVTLKDDGSESTASLKLTPASKPGGAVMDVRALRLCPTGSPRSFDSELADPASLPVKTKN